MVRLGWVLVTLVVLTVPALAPPAQPSGGMTYTLLPDGGLQLFGGGFDPQLGSATLVSDGAEPHILVDSLGRSILIGDQLGVSMSLDGGVSWFENTPPYIAGHDPIFGIGIYDGWVFAQDAVGTIYASTTNGAIINVASSTNGGLSWQLTPSTLVVEPDVIADRPWMVARGAGQVALTWNEGGLYQRCAYTTNGGLTWTQTIPGFTTNGFPIGGRPAFDSAGRVVYAGNGGVGGGAHTAYRYPTSIPCASALQQFEIPDVGDQLSTPVVADNAGRFYLAAPSADNSQLTILGFTGMSTTGMKRLVVSPPALKGNTFATISIRSTGELGVSWYATPNAGDFQVPSFQGSWNVTTARVKDFWSASPTVVYQQVTTTPSHVGNLCMQGTSCDTGGAGDRDLLDYFANTYDAAGNLHIAYGADGATTQAHVYYAKLPALV